MRNRLIAGLVSALTTVALLTPVTAHAETPSLDWKPCGSLECATLKVPLDYRKPGGPTLEVAISRLKSGNPGARRGVLLLNPGGPGGSGLDMPLMIAQLAPPSVTAAYDLIGFDPRGAGSSSRITCALTPDQLRPGKTIPYPAPDGDISANVAYAKQVAQQCGEHAGPVLPYLTTLNTARDMDRIRLALGERKISYLGGSYGSYLGAVYTTLFPAQSDRILLDSISNPDGIWRPAFRQWAPAAETRFDDFATWAAARDAEYGLGSSAAAVRATYFELVGKLDATPQGGNDFREQTRAGLYSDANFVPMAQQWRALKRGEVTVSGGPAGDPQSFYAVFWSVVCGDTAWPRSIAQHQRDVLVDKWRYPLTNGGPSTVFPCVYWPSKPIEPPLRITDRGPSNVLLTQNTRDPATPIAGARAMRAALGDRARLVTAEQGGHGAYLLTPNACVSRIATAFLVDGVQPATDVHCGPELTASDTARDQTVREVQARQFPL
ncbi:alpha/beta hydrolase fold [Amycolatopsis xylanica]|uniref:Alpha/beta hydrolase fold n=1 Tax=Amycolatopsis xylanica TaxID=589385 RepID=A0A1H3MUJ2_9PSEU|nr:alpha/beta hydrolase [Amycolatopsis xylanica]SDY80154.1 alpha/beta hydrolase fold [Amycolatopsis xylanica]